MIMWRGGRGGTGERMWLKTGVWCRMPAPPAGKYLEVPSRSEGYHVQEGSYLATGCCHYHLTRSAQLESSAGWQGAPGWAQGFTFSAAHGGQRTLTWLSGYLASLGMYS